jgi:hypothetical protein
VFERNDDADTRDLQQDIYHDALRLIASGCRRHEERATRILRIRQHAEGREAASEAVAPQWRSPAGKAWFPIITQLIGILGHPA